MVPQHIELSHFCWGVSAFAIHGIITEISYFARIGNTVVVNARSRAVILSVSRILNEYVFKFAASDSELIISDVFLELECGREIQNTLNVEAATVGSEFLWRFR